MTNYSNDTKMAKDIKKRSVLDKGQSVNKGPKGDIVKEKADMRPFTKVNFWMMGGCVALIIIGFLLMSGGGAGNGFNPDIFSTRRIVVGPTLAFLGFLLMAFAIIWTPRGSESRNGRNIEDTPHKEN